MTCIDRGKNDAPAHVRQGYSLAFEDTFESGVIDPTKWKTELPWGSGLTINNEEQYYVDILNGDTAAPNPFSFTSAGNLAITAAPITGFKPRTAQGLDGGQNYSSGIITTRDSMSFTHGYVEVCAKVPEADGAWPATWLLNSLYYNNASEKNQAENNGSGNDKFNPEIDFMEQVNGPGYRGSECVKFSYHYFTGDRQTTDTNHSLWSLGNNNFKEVNVGTGQLLTQFNVYEDCDGNNEFTLPDYCPGGLLSEDFHTYAVDWTPEYIHYYVDGMLIRCIETQSMISDQSMYLLINLAVGGNFPFGVPPSRLADPNDYPATLEVQYARIYTL